MKVPRTGILYDFNADYENYDTEDEAEAACIIYEAYIRRLNRLIGNDDGGDEAQCVPLEKWVTPSCPYNENGEYIPRSKRRDNRKHDHFTGE